MARLIALKASDLLLMGRLCLILVVLLAVAYVIAVFSVPFRVDMGVFWVVFRAFLTFRALSFVQSV